MKKTYFLFAVLFAAIASLFSVQAQTVDVTSTYLTNADFNTSCNYLTADPYSELGTANGSANIKVVSGWTIGTTVGYSAAASYEYGFVGKLNGNLIPSAGPDAASGTGQGALGISTAWNGTVTYYQDVTLPIGKYTIEYKAYNSGPNIADTSKVGWVPNLGTSVLSTKKKSFTQNTWDTDTLTFTVSSETAGKIQVGISSPNSGSSGVGRIFFDYIKILKWDTSTSQGLVISSNTEFSPYVSDNKIVVKFELVSNSEVTLSVYNVDGVLIESNKKVCIAGKNEKTFNIHFPSGVYIVRMSVNGKEFTQKLIKKS